MAGGGPVIQPWEGRRRADALRRVKADGQRHNKPCCLCGTEIDYSLDYPHPMSCSVEHVKQRAFHPELTWDPANWKPCHLRCNVRAARGTDRSTAAGPKPDLDLGAVSDW